jgi:hypothetical protein
MQLVDYRELVRFMANHTAGANDLYIKIQSLQRSYDRRPIQEEKPLRSNRPNVRRIKHDELNEKLREKLAKRVA